MTLVKLGSFLQAAFKRLDQNDTARSTRESSLIETVLKNELQLSALSVEIMVKNGTIILHTSSPMLKHRVFAEKTNLLKAIQTSCPGVVAREITFRGPKL